MYIMPNNFNIIFVTLALILSRYKLKIIKTWQSSISAAETYPLYQYDIQTKKNDDLKPK
jgi:hypothetical protein